MPAKRTVGTVITNENREIVFDITTSETRTGTVQWTEYPKSPNRQTQDHGTRGQETYNVTGEISATTLGPVLADEPFRLEILRDELFLMKDERLECSIVSGLESLTGYVINSLSTTRTAPNGNKLTVTIGFVELETTESVETTIPPARVFAGPRDNFTPQANGGEPANEELTLDGSTEAADLRNANAREGVDVSGFPAPDYIDPSWSFVGQ